MAQAALNCELLKVARTTAVIPVLTIADTASSVALAEALISGGLLVLEITLRTDQALDVITTIRKACPGAYVGAGTILLPESGERAIAAGAQFLVSPGITPRLIQAAESWPVPLLPGAATASEAMALSDLGYGFLKFFPAEQIGGAKALLSLSAPLPEIRFCPTGGVTAGNAAEYLKLPNVACVGGSWVAPKSLVSSGDWDGISRLARDAAQLKSA